LNNFLSPWVLQTLSKNYLHPLIMISIQAYFHERRVAQGAELITKQAQHKKKKLSFDY